jgi:hypothetical protein
MVRKRKTFSEYFGLHKKQHELDFVDIPIDGDTPLFIDPYAISKRNDLWSIRCHNQIVDYFQAVINSIRADNQDNAKYLLSGLREPNETGFGLSKGKVSRGRGIGREQSAWLYDALVGSNAVKTGFIKDIEDCELLIEGIDKDKISDMTTNIIKNRLIEYTQRQCLLHNIPMQEVSSGYVWNEKTGKWESEYAKLPVCKDKKKILIPKAISRFGVEFNYMEYYQHFVLNYLQQVHLKANSSLVRTLKDGTKKEPTKKSLKEKYPLKKSFLYDFSKDHQEVLAKYKDSKSKNIREITNEQITALIGNDETGNVYDLFKRELDEISSGPDQASDFHNLIIGILNAIFYPLLTNPVKEQEIHEGRKRIDITYTNSAKRGFFSELLPNKGVPAGYVFIECKNYSAEPKNPELDQIAGRFSQKRGKFGLLVCRNIEDKDLFEKRCRDTSLDDRGYIIALDDHDIKTLLDFRANEQVDLLNKFLDDRFKKLIM